MAVLLTPFFLQFEDENGQPYAGGKIYTYAAGTSTPKATFTDFTEAVQAANPIILDSAGRTTIWISGAYKLVLTDALDNIIKTTDNVTAFNVPSASANAYFQEFSGNGVQTAFTLSQDLGTDENAVMVFINNGGWIPQNPNAYTLTTGGTPAITFAVAPPNAASNIRIYAPSLLLGAASAAAAAAATSETNAAASALLASQWASQTSGIVAVTDYSAKAWAIGGTGVTNTATRGAAKEWATTTGGTVDTSEFSAKEYAVGTTATAGSSKSWATKTGSTVAVSEYSAKEYAQGTSVPTGSSKDWAKKTSATVDGAGYSSKEWATGTQTRGLASGGSAKDWATYTGGTVDNSEFSAKKYAADAAASALQFQGTSTTSVTVGTGTKTFTTQAGKLFNGENVRVYSAALPSKFVDGIATYSGTTLDVNVANTASFGGSGSATDWVIKVNGVQGVQGNPGSVTDGDKGDIVVSASGTIWTVDPTGNLIFNTLALNAATNQIVFDADGSFTGTMTMAVLGASRTWTLPNASGTIVLTSNATTLTNKTLDNTSTITVLDTGFVMQDNSDNTKQVNWELSGVSTATTRTITMPNKSGTMAMLSDITSSAGYSGSLSLNGQTAIDVTSIPSTVTRIVVTFKGLSLNGTGNPLIQLGDSGGIENTGYASYAQDMSNNLNTGGTDAFYLARLNNAGAVYDACVIIELTDATTNTWSMVSGGNNAGTPIISANGTKSLSATLDRIRITLTAGAFDAGSATVKYQ